MDARAPWTGHLTKPAQHDKQGCGLEWILPLEPGLATHVMLNDLRCDPPHAVAIGHGADEAEALLDLWRTLNDQSEPAAAIGLVADAYERRTGRPPNSER